VTVIKINAITVAADSGDELAKRFAKRAGAVDGQDGFEGFELLQPTDDRTTWLVITRWRDEDAFNAWVSSRPSAPGTRARAARPPRARRTPKPATVRRVDPSPSGSRPSCGATSSPAARRATADLPA
jgi:heme-degrading monooxygenase HmoA